MSVNSKSEPVFAFDGISLAAASEWYTSTAQECTVPDQQTAALASAVKHMLELEHLQHLERDGKYSKFSPFFVYSPSYVILFLRLFLSNVIHSSSSSGK